VHDGLVVVDKPAGCTSHDVVARLRRTYGQRRIGHAGTLDPGKSATATLHVPAAAPFFADHFPRRPVFPATLLLDAQIGLAMRLAQSADVFAATGVHPTRMSNVKVRAFMAPGDVLDLATELTPIDQRSARIALTARANGKLAATARLEVAAGAPS